MGQYLEQSISTFLSQQDRIRAQMESMIDASNPLKMMNKIAGQNMAMWNIFKPEGEEGQEGAASGKEGATGPADADDAPSDKS